MFDLASSCLFHTHTHRFNGPLSGTNKDFIIVWRTKVVNDEQRCRLWGGVYSGVGGRLRRLWDLGGRDSSVPSQWACTRARAPRSAPDAAAEVWVNAAAQSARHWRGRAVGLQGFHCCRSCLRLGRHARCRGTSSLSVTSYSAVGSAVIRWTDVVVFVWNFNAAKVQFGRYGCHSVHSKYDAYNAQCGFFENVWLRLVSLHPSDILRFMISRHSSNTDCMFTIEQELTWKYTPMILINY